jgi:1-deoxy-D-xylulose-5-phosphate synthase
MWENAWIMSPPAGPLLDAIGSLEHLRRPPGQAPRPAVELRSGSTPAVTGGHVGTGLGVIELTVALRHVCNTPPGRLARDVGHQAYPYKIHGVICVIGDGAMSAGMARWEKTRQRRECRPHPHREHMHEGRCGPTPRLLRRRGPRHRDRRARAREEDVINTLRTPGPVEVSTLPGREEHIEFRLPRELATA